MICFRKAVVFVTLAIGFAGYSQAALYDRGGGMLYDNVINITWLQDANYAKTSGYDADGRMSWVSASYWAENLDFGGYSDWRLPKVIDTGSNGCDAYYYSGGECGPNVATTNSELAHMYFENLGLKSSLSVTGEYQSDYGIFRNGTSNGIDNTSFGQRDVGLVKNLQAEIYWSGSLYPGRDVAWYFFTLNGNQSWTNVIFENYAWAVRDGDVAAVPIPGSIWLFISAFACFIRFNHSKHQ
jgi:hypothetical protein